MTNSLEVIVKDPIKGTDLGLSKEPIKQGSSDFAFKNPSVIKIINQGSTLNATSNQTPSAPPRA